ncbi:LacI family DNA-binding transcriptional regulator [Rhizobium grahamii]|uniref:LacI family transcriptional regulator n=1 Tax=Rhizobium grahamii CCGE 502 TaxID=990285 RepID=S3HCM2_9HYPH|nr:LacI family transcriptional regulator [Rhizobium grahamii CCGE 502]
MKERKVKNPRRVTMADVARAAGCSQATVSLVLNHVTEVRISSELRQRVIETARELGYGQASFVKSLVLQELRGACIGFVVDQLATTPEAVNAIDGARQASWGHDINVLVGQTLDHSDRENIVVERLLRAGAEGIVLMSIFSRRISLSETMRRLPVPLVLLNCYTDDCQFPSVVPDEVVGGMRATRALIDYGHERIATITGEMFMDAASDRLTGYRMALKRSGIAECPYYIAQGNWTPSSGYEATAALMSIKTPPTAIFCQNDKMAIGCLNALLDRGLRVPEDVSVIGYDDDELARHLRPQLTTVDLPHRSMGAWAIAQLARGKHKSHNPIEVTKMECALVSRGSASWLSATLR